MLATSFIHATSTKLALASVFAASLVACGGSDYVPPAPVVATTNAVVAIDPTASAATQATQKTALAAVAVAATATAPVSITAAQAATATVTGAAAAFTAPVTLAFTTKDATAAATVDTGVSLASGTQTATGDNTFGSCTIKVKTVTGAGPFAVNMQIVWPFCQFTLPTQNVVVGSTTLAPVFQFGQTSLTSNSITTTVKIPVTISSTGSVTANGVNTGSTVSTQSSTGATGA